MTGPNGGLPLPSVPLPIVLKQPSEAAQQNSRRLPPVQAFRDHFSLD